jgi:hypothetical protein
MVDESSDEDELSEEELPEDDEVEELLVDDPDDVLVELTCAVLVDEPSAGSLPAAIWT